MQVVSSCIIVRKRCNALLKIICMGRSGSAFMHPRMWQGSAYSGRYASEAKERSKWRAHICRHCEIASKSEGGQRLTMRAADLLAVGDSGAASRCDGSDTTDVTSVIPFLGVPRRVACNCAIASTTTNGTMTNMTPVISHGYLKTPATPSIHMGLKELELKIITASLSWPSLFFCGFHSRLPLEPISWDNLRSRSNDNDPLSTKLLYYFRHKYVSCGPILPPLVLHLLPFDTLPYARA